MGWCPTTEAEVRPALDVLYEPLPEATGGALHVMFGDGSSIIAIDPRLEGPERRDALAHELVHVERGGGAYGRGCHRFRPDRVREERRVNRIVAERLVPARDLSAFCDRMADRGEGVGPTEVMSEYDVSRRVAEYALDNLTRWERGPGREAAGRIR